MGTVAMPTTAGPNYMRPRPIVLIAMVIGWFATAAAAFAQGGPSPPPSVTVAKPVVKEIMEWDEFIGRFEAVDQVDVRAGVGL